MSDPGNKAIAGSALPSEQADTASAATRECGSDLYRSHIAGLPAGDISRRVWDGTPWMLSAFTDSTSADNGQRYRKMAEWCRERWGEEAFPFGNNPRPGEWRIGNATVFGWTWWGFATEGQMQAFAEAWPEPALRVASPKPDDAGSVAIAGGQSDPGSPPSSLPESTP